LRRQEVLSIEVCASWEDLIEPTSMGVLRAAPGRGKEIFSFDYAAEWLESGHSQQLDPSLSLYIGRQYAPDNLGNFGMFLDSAPDRWGRLLMRRREAVKAREEGRSERLLKESDYLLGVHDSYRMGGLRFRVDVTGPYLDNRDKYAVPPLTSLRELEHASFELERDGVESDHHYSKWLMMLMAPGASLGGARPKASVVDEHGLLWLAKFPSRHDSIDQGAWETVVHDLAKEAGVDVAPAFSRKFDGRHHTFLAKRFDRTNTCGRVHFASAMTLLGRKDGDDGESGVSYLDLAEVIMRQGVHPSRDLEQLWRRIVFNIFVSNTDDHLRNHGFLLEANGWALSPAYDMNPDETGEGLKLNISATDNAQEIDLALSVAEFFRLSETRAVEILRDVKAVVQLWPNVASRLEISSSEQALMKRAFRCAR
jgi:serine/threonine-protein kinase HipA